MLDDPKRTTIKPSPDEIQRHLEEISRDWDELNEQVLLELRALGTNSASHRSFEPNDLANATKWAVSQNLGGNNVYVLVNPKRADARDRAANNDDIVCAFFQFLDFDKEAGAAVANELSRSFAVVTGTAPHWRGHLYMRLDKPQYNLEAWRYLQRALAERHGADRAVNNPARLMRLAGTINIPSTKKLAKGHQTELTSLKVGSAEPFSNEQLQNTVERSARDAPLTPTQAEERRLGAALVEAARQETSGSLLELLKSKRNVIDDREDYLDLCFGLHSGYAGTRWEDEAREAFIGWALRWEATPLRCAKELRRHAERDWHSAKADGGVTVRSAWRLLRGQPEILPELSDAPLTSFSPKPLNQLAPIPWLYGHHHQRGALTITSAPGGTGKSLLAVGEALAMATGVNLLGQRIHRPLKVWYISGEENELVLQQRFNAAIHRHDLKARDLMGRLFVTSSEELALTFGGEPKLVRSEGRSTVVDEAMKERIVEISKRTQIDLLILDPLKKFHSVDENDNGAMDLVASVLAQIAIAANIGVEAVHHGTKEARSKGSQLGVAGARGASSLIDAARSARHLVQMSNEEANQWNLLEADEFVQVLRGKSNNAKKGKCGKHWFKVVAVELDNGTDEYPDGDSVGVAQRWSPPQKDPMADWNDKLAALHSVKDIEFPKRVNQQANDWIGFDLAQALKIDVGAEGSSRETRTNDQQVARARVIRLINALVKDRILLKEQVRSNGKPIPMYNVDLTAIQRLLDGMGAGAAPPSLDPHLDKSRAGCSRGGG